MGLAVPSVRTSADRPCRRVEGLAPVLASPPVLHFHLEVRAGGIIERQPRFVVSTAGFADLDRRKRRVEGDGVGGGRGTARHRPRKQSDHEPRRLCIDVSRASAQLPIARPSSAPSAGGCRNAGRSASHRAWLAVVLQLAASAAQVATALRCCSGCRLPVALVQVAPLHVVPADHVVEPREQ
jgi:hypothetical protein